MFIKKRILIMLLSCFAGEQLHAQSIGLGGQVDHLSDGILASYTPHWKNTRWTLDLGLRFMINTKEFNDNEEAFIYYQNGYAKSLYERISFNARISRKIVGYKMFRLEFMANLFISWHGLLQKESHFPIWDADGNQIGTMYEEIYRKPSPAAELTIGPLLAVQLSHRVSVYGTFGIGYLYMHYSHKMHALISNTTGYGYSLAHPSWKRGDTEWVGLDRLPMISVGVKYKLK